MQDECYITLAKQRQRTSGLTHCESVQGNSYLNRYVEKIWLKRTLKID